MFKLEFDPKGGNTSTVNTFDSATGLQNAVEQNQSRLEQATDEHFRHEAVDIVSTLLSNAEDDFEDVLPSALLDDSIAESLEDLGFDDGDHETAKHAENMLLACITDLLDGLGVDSSTVQDMFSDNVDLADSSIENACQTALANLPDDDEIDDFYTSFVYGDDISHEFDSATLTAGKVSTKKRGNQKFKYVAVKAVRNGKITTVNKRVKGQGKVKLSPAQKQALAKAQAKAQTGASKARRELSVIKGLKAGLYKHHAFMGKL